MPIADGTFYPASYFRVHSGSSLPLPADSGSSLPIPADLDLLISDCTILYYCITGSSLPFPADLLISRNHFNLNWAGERRLKNSIMVLDWAPSAQGLSLLPPSAAVLTDSQQERLSSAVLCCSPAVLCCSSVVAGAAELGCTMLCCSLAVQYHSSAVAGAAELGASATRFRCEWRLWPR